MFMDGSGDMKTDVKLCLGEEFCDALKDRQLIVRCKDCKHYRYYGLSVETVSECTINHCENPDADWFCADGERRTEWRE